jgi:hypothetical protein
MLSMTHASKTYGVAWFGLIVSVGSEPQRYKEPTRRPNRKSMDATDCCSTPIQGMWSVFMEKPTFVA